MASTQWHTPSSINHRTYWYSPTYQVVSTRHHRSTGIAPSPSQSAPPSHETLKHPAPSHSSLSCATPCGLPYSRLLSPSAILPAIAFFCSFEAKEKKRLVECLFLHILGAKRLGTRKIRWPEIVNPSRINYKHFRAQRPESDISRHKCHPGLA